MRTRYRTIFLSDIHIGMDGSQTEKLNQFLKTVECDYLILAGDIIDIWNLRKGFHWDDGSTKLIRRVLKMSQSGTDIIYIVGNHDDAIRNVTPLRMGNIFFTDSYTHETATGDRLLVIHGDQFDFVVSNMKWLALIGTVAYNYLMKINAFITWTRAKMGLPYWSFATFVKYKVKQATLAIRNFELGLVNLAKSQGASGVVCGHIHVPKIEEIDGIMYYNCGDWTESCSVIVEHDCGEISLLRITD